MMKKLFYFSFFLLLSVSISAQADGLEVKKWEFGIQTSLMAHQLKDMDMNPSRDRYQSNTSFGLQMGALGRYAIDQQWVLELQSGIHFLEHEVLSDEESPILDVQQLYFFLDPNIQYYFSKHSNKRWYLNAGTQIGFGLLNGHHNAVASLGNMTNIHLGVGHEWKLDKFRIAPQLSFHYNPTNIQPHVSSVFPFRMNMLRLGVKIYG